MVGGAEIVWDLLKNDADVAAAVSSDSDGNVAIYTDHVPQHATLPFIVLFTISHVPVESQDGFSGVFIERMQVDVYADMPDTVRDVAQKVFMALMHPPNQDVQGNEMQDIAYLDGQGFAVDDGDADEVPLNRYSMDFRVSYNASKPSFQ